MTPLMSNGAMEVIAVYSIKTKMSLEKLWQFEPLGDSIDKITPFVCVSDFRKLRLCGFSDCLIDVHVEWSYDGESKGVSSSIKLASEHWRSEELAVMMPYLRLHVINNSGRTNSGLIITVHAFGQFPPPAPPIQAPLAPSEPVSILVDSERDSGPADEKPKRRVWFGKKAASPKHVCRDERLPGFLPKNALLIADKRGSLVPLAPGNVGDVLMMACDGPRWISREQQSDVDTQFVFE